MGGRTLEDYMGKEIESAVADADLADDVYAFSLWVSYRDDDPRQPEVRFGSNTESQVTRSLDAASDPIEARWNFAFWQQDEICTFGTDGYSATFLTAWLKYDCGLWFTDEEDENDPDATLELEQQMQFRFFRKMIDVVQLVYERGQLRAAVGRDLPMVIHELEYYDEIAVVNERADVRGLLPPEFYEFCMSG